MKSVCRISQPLLAFYTGIIVTNQCLPKYFTMLGWHRHHTLIEKFLSHRGSNAPYEFKATSLKRVITVTYTHITYLNSIIYIILAEWSLGLRQDAFNSSSREGGGSIFSGKETFGQCRYPQNIVRNINRNRFIYSHTYNV